MLSTLKSRIVERLHVIGMSGCNLRFRNGCFIPNVALLHFLLQKASSLLAFRRRDMAFGGSLFQKDAYTNVMQNTLPTIWLKMEL